MSKTIDKQSKNSGRDSKGRFLPGHQEGFQKGNSGNPEGRSKRKTLTELLVGQLDEVCPQDKQGRTWGEVIVAATLTHGVKGQAAALQEVWNRSDGKVKDTHEISGLDGGPIEVSPVEKINAQLDAQAACREAPPDNEQPDPRGG